MTKPKFQRRCCRPDEREMASYRKLADFFAGMTMQDLFDEAQDLEARISGCAGFIDVSALYGMRCARSQVLLMMAVRQAQMPEELMLKISAFANLESSAPIYDALEVIGNASIEADLARLQPHSDISK